MKCSADLLHLPQVLAFVEDTLCSAGCPHAGILQLSMACEEIFVNICNYSNAHQVEICVCSDSEAARVQFADDGCPFDPTRDAPPPDLAQDASARPIGGLGIHMVRQLTNGLEYRRTAGKNILLLVKTWPVPDDPHHTS